METTAIGTSQDGQVFTRTLSITTTIAPGTVITETPVSRSQSGTSNIGAIVGGVVGGIAALAILALLLFFCMRKRRKDEFDGNFDPAHVNSVKGGGGGTLPKIDLGEGGLLGNGAGEVEEDDGMGGRIASGADGGGIIVPYAFQPSTPIHGGQQYQNQQYPQMQQMANIGVAAGGIGASSSSGRYGDEKRALRQQYASTPNSNPGYSQQQQIYSTPLTHHTSNPSVSSGSHYATTASHQPLAESYGPGGASDGSSSVGGSAAVDGVYYHNQSLGRGPSPGQSVLSSSSGGGGRNVKEMEAMGRVVVNPEEGQYGPQQGQQYGQYPAFQAYLQNGPGPHQQHYQQPSSSSSAGNQTSPRAGSAVVVHEDGGRVILRKGGEEEGGGGEVLSPEIPPTYDSLPAGVRRDS